ncbi:vanadium-dependent haloperoxidase [Paenisporosarcina antarctica]|uniref:Phosphatase PAP2 family protein n=1 Tax=Paenisporosarcina antarctica TaxID=417367 RepID=A0A4P6ZYV3_9BACL|nr:vanadium-dependent haloperoxidase [Paenisporosarcina antarctica]QBP41279.1 phosphatase PAP2 family protein [Paenisporosarcina antarctica]
MSKKYLRWSKVPYAGESRPPGNAVTSNAGSWSLTYLKRNRKGDFLNPKGVKMHLPIKHPDHIDFENELKIVQSTLRNLTPIQEKIGIFYGTGVPTKQWTPVIDRLIDSYGVSPVYAARILTAVQGAVNDTMIVVWDYKYKWDTARPNQYDHKMDTILCTPRFPTYPSGHASMSGCSEVLLSYFFPGEAKKLRKFAEDDSVSRLYAGVHFPIDNTEGLKLGRFIGKVVVDHLKTQRNPNHTPIDTPYREYRNADFFADDFNQFIPYDFTDDCSSRVKGKDKDREKYSYRDSDKLKDKEKHSYEGKDKIKDNSRDKHKSVGSDTYKNLYSDNKRDIERYNNRHDDVYSDKDKFKDIESSIDSEKHNDKAESSSHQNRRSPHPFFNFKNLF